MFSMMQMFKDILPIPDECPCVNGVQLDPHIFMPENDDVEITLTLVPDDEDYDDFSSDL